MILFWRRLKMELLLHKVCGQPAALPVTIRRCGPADADAFYTLQNEVRAAMPHPEQFVPDTLENITAYLTGDLCLGVYDGARLGPISSCATAARVSTITRRFWASRRASGTTGPTPTVPSSTRTGGATACSASSLKPRCPCSAPASWASGPPSAPKTSTV